MTTTAAAGPDAVTITVLDRPQDVDDALVARLGVLVRQLSSSADLPTREEVEAIATSPSCHLLLARPAGDGPVLGMLTLVAFPLPSGIRAQIEDVVVDEAARGRGVAGALVAAGLDLARAQGARAVDLTSRPSREAANRLYRRMGFATRETNVYRFTLDAVDTVDAAERAAGAGTDSGGAAAARS